MAVLTAEQLVKLRQGFESEGDVATWVKVDLNVVFQAIEDWFESNRGGLNGAIIAATAPGHFPGDAMKNMAKHWQLYKHGQGG